MDDLQLQLEFSRTSWWGQVRKLEHRERPQVQCHLGLEVGSFTAPGCALAHSALHTQDTKQLEDHCQQAVSDAKLCCILTGLLFMIALEW